MSEPKSVLRRNWMKAGLGLLYCKEGIQDFVSDVMDNFQRQTYTNIGGRCYTCTTQNVLTCPTPGICAVRRCNFHDNTDPGKISRQCPQNICEKVRDEIIQEHRYGKPSFRNTKAEYWSSNPWEIAKCYMAPTGYLDKQTADNTDFSGLISVILNCMSFQNHVNENLAVQGNLFEQARECRNSIMHNANMEVSTADLRNHLQILKHILTDPSTIQHLPNAQTALRKIIDLENDVVVITTEDETKLREESRKALREGIEELRQTTEDSVGVLDEKREDLLRVLRDTTTVSARSVNETRDQSLHKLRETAKEGSKNLERERNTHIHAMQDTIASGTRSLNEIRDQGLLELGKTRQEGSNILDNKRDAHIHAMQDATESGTRSLNITRLQGLQDLREMTEEGTDILERKRDAHKHVLQDTAESGTRSLNETRKQGLHELRETIEEGTNILERERDAHIHVIQDTADQGARLVNVTRDQGLHKLRETIEEGTNILERERDAHLRAIQEKVDENSKSRKSTQTSLAGNINGDYLQMKTNLQKEVIRHYQTNGYCKSAIPVLIDDEEIDIQDFYVTPTMEVKQDKNSDPDYYGSTVSFIHELFPHETIRRVCIQGEAGYGKTSFCKHLISSWCKVHSGNNTGKLCENDISFLKSLELLFYIPLRNYEITDVIEMIKQELVRKALHDILTIVFKNKSEKCLIIFDGLDEYSSGLPQIDMRENYKVIFTSRPWKIESLRPKQYLLGRVVQLTKMEENDDLIKAVVESLNTRERTKLDWTKFKYVEYKGEGRYNEETSQYEKIQHLAEIPVILIQMVCMWFGGEELGNTRTEIYTSMLQYLFKVAEKYRPEAVQKCLSKQNIDTLTRKSFKDLKIINDLFSGLFFKIADFAFHTLFNNEQGELLVFSHSDMWIDGFGLSEQDIEFCLSLGILSQEKIHRKSTKQEKSLSFLHKTLQEFFAAIHVAFSGESLLREMLGRLQISDLFQIHEIVFFVVGISFRHISEISNHISRIVDTDKQILNYRMAKESSDYTAFKVQRLLCDLCDERQVDNPGERQLINLRDVILTRGDDRVQNSLLPYLNIDSVKSLSVKDVDQLRDPRVLRILNGVQYLVKLAAVVQVQEDVDIITGIINRSHAHLKSIIITSLSSKTVVSFRALIDSMITIDMLSCLVFSYLSLKHEELKTFGHWLVKFKHIEELCLDNITCVTCSSKHRTCRIELSFSERLRKLKLSRVDGYIQLGSHPCLDSIVLDEVKIMKLDLSIYKQLKYVNLQYISCPTCTHEECCCTVDLQYNKQLRILVLLGLKRQVVLDPLHSLESVSLEYSKKLVPVLNQLKNSFCLNYLSLRRNTLHRILGDQQMELKGVIGEVLPTLHSLQTLWLDGIDLDDDDLIIPREMKHLKVVELGGMVHPVTMTLQCVKRFVDSIIQVQHTLEVEIWRVYIRPVQDTREAVQYIRDNCHVICGGIKGFNDKHDEDGEHDMDKRVNRTLQCWRYEDCWLLRTATEKSNFDMKDKKNVVEI